MRERGKGRRRAAGGRGALRADRGGGDKGPDRGSGPLDFPIPPFSLIPRQKRAPPSAAYRLGSRFLQ